MMTKNVFKIPKGKLCDFVMRLLEEYEVYAPVDGQKRFSRVEDVERISLGANRTAISPKPLFFPPEERMFLWRRSDGDYEIEDLLREEGEKVLFGVRGCDVRAMKILDKYMLGEFSDPYYLARRKAVVIGMTCDFPRESCFCAAFGPMIPGDYDLWLTDIGRYYVVQVGTQRGMELIHSDLFQEATEEDLSKAMRKVERLEDEIRRRAGVDLCEIKRCSQNIKSKANDPMWDELGKICLSCGKCNFYCPTCHCFDVRDVVDMDGSSGHRVRVWDSCHLYEYAKTSAENFRKERHARVRYRVYDKFVFPVMRYGMYACTGCGRCYEVCPANIDLRDVLRRLVS